MLYFQWALRRTEYLLKPQNQDTQTSSVDPTSSTLFTTSAGGAVGGSGDLKDVPKGSAVWERIERRRVAS